MLTQPTYVQALRGDARTQDRGSSTSEGACVPAWRKTVRNDVNSPVQQALGTDFGKRKRCQDTSDAALASTRWGSERTSGRGSVARCLAIAARNQSSASSERTSGRGSVASTGRGCTREGRPPTRNGLREEEALPVPCPLASTVENFIDSLDPLSGIGYVSPRYSTMTTQLHTELPSAGEDTHHTMVGVAQLVERSVVIRDAAGSSPVAHPTSSGELFT